MSRIDKRESARPRERAKAGDAAGTGAPRVAVEGAGAAAGARPLAKQGDVDALGELPGVAHAAQLVSAQEPSDGFARSVAGTRGLATGPATRTPGETGEYAKLAALGAFKGYVSTPAGEIYVEVKPGRAKDAAKRPPVVFLDGLDACARAVPTDETVVRVDLVGQLYTLHRDLTRNGGRSIGRDIDPRRQVEAVIGALDALGVDKPVHIFGLSYGGMIAALTKQAHPERVDALMLCAPYVHSTACGDPVRDCAYAMLMQNPFNPMGAWMYRAAARASLAGGVATVPPLLVMHAPLYAEAMYRMSMGLEGKRLDQVVAGLDNVHVLSAPGDVMSPPLSAQQAQQRAGSGTYTLAPMYLTLQHDLPRMAPHVVGNFIDRSLQYSAERATAATDGAVVSHARARQRNVKEQ